VELQAEVFDPVHIGHVREYCKISLAVTLARVVSDDDCCEMAAIEGDTVTDATERSPW